MESLKNLSQSIVTPKVLEEKALSYQKAYVKLHDVIKGSMTPAFRIIKREFRFSKIVTFQRCYLIESILSNVAKRQLLRAFDTIKKVKYHKYQVYCKNVGITRNLQALIDRKSQVGQAFFLLKNCMTKESRMKVSMLKVNYLNNMFQKMKIKLLKPYFAIMHAYLPDDFNQDENGFIRASRVRDGVDVLSNMSGSMLESGANLGKGRMLRDISSGSRSQSDIMKDSIVKKKVRPDQVATRRSEVVQPHTKEIFTRHKHSSSREIKRFTPETSIKDNSIDTSVQQKHQLLTDPIQTTNKKMAMKKSMRSNTQASSKLSRQPSVLSSLNKDGKKNKKNPLRQSGRVSALGSVANSRTASKKGGLNKYKKKGKGSKRQSKVNMNLKGFNRKDNPSSSNLGIG